MGTDEAQLLFLRGACFHQYAISLIEKCIRKVDDNKAEVLREAVAAAKAAEKVAAQEASAAAAAARKAAADALKADNEDSCEETSTNNSSTAISAKKKKKKKKSKSSAASSSATPSHFLSNYSYEGSPTTVPVLENGISSISSENLSDYKAEFSKYSEQVNPQNCMERRWK